MREIRRQEQSEKAKGKALSHISEALAANKIQSLWKGAIARKKVRKEREEELIFIGMVCIKLKKSANVHLIYKCINKVKP